MEGNEFSNGLLGHRVEVKVGSKSPLQILTIIDKVITHEMAVDSMADGKWIPTTYDMYMVMNEAGVVDMIAPHTIGRVIRPPSEAVMPAEPYSIATLDDRFRLCKEILGPNGYTFQWTTESVDGTGYTIWKDGEFAFIGQQGVYKTKTRDGIVIPLNEWVKNPTIESLKPKD